MNTDAGSNHEDALTQAYATIKEQQIQIETLQKRVEENHHAVIIRDAYTLMATARTIATPVTHNVLLDMIVNIAARVMSARAASLFLLDTEKNELIFEVAIGPKAAEVKRHRVPLGHGIAGFVALSGQPLAIVNAENNDLHASDISQSVGYVPYSILGVPLFYQDQVIGVLELLDKEGDEPFDNNDMDLGSMFAHQAAVAIELSRTHNYLMTLFSDLLQTNTSESQAYRELVLGHGRLFSEKLEKETALKDALEFATLVQELTWYGEAERKACGDILKSFVQYVRLRSTPVNS